MAERKCLMTFDDYAEYKKELEEVRARQIAENAEIEFSRAVKDACLRKAMKKRK